MASKLDPNIKIFKLSVNHSYQIAEFESQHQTSPWSLITLKRILENELSCSFGHITESDQILSYVIAHDYPDAIHILNLFVVPQRRRRGYARQLLNHLIHIHRDRQFLLEFRSSNTEAQNLYSSLGFRNDGIRKAYYRNGEDAKLMSKVQK